jgi:hypothetical protein
MQFANVMVENVRNDIKIANDYSVAWIWNEDTLLWEEGGIEKARLYASEILVKNEGEPYEKYLHTVGAITGIWTIARCKLVDEYFAKTINTKEKFFPCKGGRVVDFETRTVRTRTKEDWFSWESPCQYLLFVPPEDKKKVDTYFKNLVQGASQDVAIQEEWTDFLLWTICTD